MVAQDDLAQSRHCPKVLPGLNLRCMFTAEAMCKRDVVDAHFEELEEIDASESHYRRLNAKEMLTSMNDEKFSFPIAVKPFQRR